MALDTKQVLMVCVSVGAVLASPKPIALAAPTISCSRNISFGRIIPNCTGSVTVRATAGSGTINSGCHSLISGAIQPAICTAQTTIGVATQDVRVTFTRGNLPFSNTGGFGQVTYDQFLIQTAGGSQLNTHTFSAALLNPSHVFRVGGRLRFNDNEPSGTYNGSIQVVVVSIP